MTGPMDPQKLLATAAVCLMASPLVVLAYIGLSAAWWKYFRPWFRRRGRG